MRRRRRGMTLTELLTVVSVISILTSMMSPILLRAHKEAVRRSCMANVQEIGLTLQLIANDNFGKFPRCFDPQNDAPGVSSQPNEDSWWYRKVDRKVHPTGSYSGTNYDQLTVPYRRDKSWWNTARSNHAPLQTFDPARTLLRCPASLDMYDQKYTKIHPHATDATTFKGIDKDRVFDDCYGYNNTGFKYDSGYGDECVIYYRDNNKYFDRSSQLYHVPADSNSGGGVAGKLRPIQGRYPKPGDSDYDPDKGYIGALADYYDPAGTVLLMDYIKADISMPQDNRGDVTVGTETYHFPDGGRFRHGGRANVLFADGHIEGFRDKIFRASSAVGKPKQNIHFTVYRRPPVN
ncbi:prepilin-type N-terminal cleavage/methylation domain-containing protein [Planctomycetota bacterium]